MNHECIKIKKKNKDTECEIDISTVGGHSKPSWRIRLSCSDKRINDIEYCPYCGVNLYMEFKKLRVKLDDKCPKCLRKNCNCKIIKEMKDIGWKVEQITNRGDYRIITPQNMVYKIIYCEEARAWNFAVKEYLKK